MRFRSTSRQCTYDFADLKSLLAKASPARSGDELAGIAAETDVERAAAKAALADVPLAHFLNEAVIPYEEDEVTRLIVDSHDAAAFAPLKSLTVGEFREWILSEERTAPEMEAVRAGVTPEMTAAVSKLMRNQDLILAAKKCSVVTRFRCTIGLPGRLSVRLQPNHPTDDIPGILASTIDGLMYGCGDAVIGINPASESITTATKLLQVLDEFRIRFDAPIQSCVLTHVTDTLQMIERRVPVDLVFQSIAGTEKANRSFGISISLLDQAHEAALELHRGTVGTDCMYFETGQGAHSPRRQTSAWTSKRVRPGPMPLRAGFDRCW